MPFLEVRAQQILVGQNRGKSKYVRISWDEATTPSFPANWTGRAINTISGDWITSKRCMGQATSSDLVEVSKVTGEMMDQWRKDYPEAFDREYDPAAGLRNDAWVVD